MPRLTSSNRQRTAVETSPLSSLPLQGSVHNLTAQSLPNIGIVEGSLTEKIVGELWSAVENAKNEPVSLKGSLAGNITESLVLDHSARILKDFTTEVLPGFIKLYLEKFGGPPVKYISLKTNDYNFVLDKLWVNFQNKHEFNPLHDHSGALSFVIWMRIPTSHKKQAELPHIKDANVKQFVSNFCFNYVDILGNLKTFAYGMEKSMEGRMATQTLSRKMKEKEKVS